MWLNIMWSNVNKTKKVIESKIDFCIERMQQPLISDSLKEEFKNIILTQAIRFSQSD